MTTATGDQHSSPDWLAPQEEQSALSRFVRVLRERAWLIIAMVVLSIGAAVGYVVVTPKTYTAHAEMIVSPAPKDLATLGLSLITESYDPTRELATAAGLIASRRVANRVSERLGGGRDGAELLRKVSAVPIAQSSLISIEGSGGTPVDAQRIANLFAEETVRIQTTELHKQLDTLIMSLRGRLDELSSGERTQTELQQRLATLQTLRAGPDPTIRVINPAERPEAAASPNVRLSLIAALVAGLVLAIGAALALETLDPRLRREEQVRELFALPIIARISKDTRRRAQGPLTPERASSAMREGYRTLRAALATLPRSGTTASRGRSVLVTGSAPAEGKSTTALNCAHGLAAAGHRVILVEADLHRPTLAQAKGLRATYGTESVLIGDVSLADALVSDPRTEPNLRFLLAQSSGGAVADRLALPSALGLISEATKMADFVIIDSPPITEVADALPLAIVADDVLFVARLGRSRLQRMRQLGELLAHNGVRPLGVVLIGVPRRDSGDYYYYTDRGTGAATAIASAPAEDAEAIGARSS